MKIFATVLSMIFFMVSTSIAEDTMSSVFDKVDELLTRVESGIALNSFAETFAIMKLDYNKALNESGRVENPLLSDRMKDVISRLDDYARIWKLQEIDGYKAVPAKRETLSKYSLRDCRISTRSGDLYNISCVKTVVLNDLKPIIEKAKSAHYNGW